MKLLIVLLIGLNLIGCDPEESFFIDRYEINFRNTTNEEVKVLFYSLVSDDDSESGLKEVVDAIILQPNTKVKSNFIYNSETNNKSDVRLIIKENINSLFSDRINDGSKFELYLDDQLIKVWKSEPAYLGDEINSPYNYDSWEAMRYDNAINYNGDIFIHGELVFTIYGDDILTN